MQQMMADRMAGPATGPAAADRSRVMRRPAAMSATRAPAAITQPAVRTGIPPRVNSARAPQLTQNPRGAAASSRSAPESSDPLIAAKIQYPKDASSASAVKVTHAANGPAVKTIASSHGDSHSRTATQTDTL